jgi:hypothetical protein
VRSVASCAHNRFMFIKEATGLTLTSVRCCALPTKEANGASPALSSFWCNRFADDEGNGASRSGYLVLNYGVSPSSGHC